MDTETLRNYLSTASISNHYHNDSEDKVSENQEEEKEEINTESSLEDNYNKRESLARVLI